MARWKVERRGGGCAACEKQFDSGETIQSLLDVTGEGLLRQDFCVSCWQAGEAGQGLGPALGAGPSEADQSSPSPSSGEEDAQLPSATTESSSSKDRFWWSSRHQEEDQRAVRMDMDVLGQLFDALAPRKEVRLQEIRYVVCLLLLRKRRLKVARVVREQGSEAFLVKKPRLDELHRVEVYDFTPERMESLRHELQALLDGAGTDDDPEDLLNQAEPVQIEEAGASAEFGDSGPGDPVGGSAQEDPRESRADEGA